MNAKRMAPWLIPVCVLVGQIQAAADQPHDTKKPARHRLQLDSGRTIDVDAIFGKQRLSFEAALKGELNSRQVKPIRFFHDGTSKPLLWAGRRGKVLHGPLASYTEDGSPIAYVDYKKGRLSSTVMTWDEQHRPLVFASYQGGDLHGLRCLFTACSEQCQSGHLRLIQEWDKGKLRAAHLATSEGTAVTVQYRKGEPLNAYGDVAEKLDLATTELDHLQMKFDKDERRLKQLVEQAYWQERVAAEQAKLFASQQRYRYLMSLGTTASRSGGFAATGSLGFS